MLKIFWIFLIFGVAIKDTKAATLRDIINGFDPESDKYDRIIEVLQALIQRFFIMYRQSYNANKYYAERSGVNQQTVQFDGDSLESFSFDAIEDLNEPKVIEAHEEKDENQNKPQAFHTHAQNIEEQNEPVAFEAQTKDQNKNQESAKNQSKENIQEIESPTTDESPSEPEPTTTEVPVEDQTISDEDDFTF